MKDKRKGALKGLLVFLCVILALTFFSRTIYYGTLPKVEVERVKGGVLQYEITGSAFIFESDQAHRVDLPLDLSDEKLHVRNVAVVEREMVKRGAALVSFDPVASASALKTAELALQRAEEALSAWDQGYLSACAKLDADLKEAAQKLSAPDTDAAALNRQIRSMQEELELLEKTRILSGASRLEKEQAASDALSKVRALSALRDADWTIFADMDAFVSGVAVKPNDEYAGLLPLLWLFPADADIRVGIETDSDVSLEIPENVAVFAGDAQWTFAGEGARGGKRVLWAELEGGREALERLSRLTFRAESEYVQHLVPNGAVQGGAVYVLDTRLGAFGVEEHFARRVEVRGVQSDDKNSAISVGLSGQDLVIVGWDRPFLDGNTVILPLD